MDSHIVTHHHPPAANDHSPAAVVIPVLSGITILLNITPFVWHVKHRNLSAAGLVFWIILALFWDFINALIWPRDDIYNWFKGFILCDIEVKFMLGATVGIPGSLASIMRNLALILDTNNPVMGQSAAQRRRKLMIECLFTFGFSAYMMAIHYVVQPSRYYIYAIAGCVVSFDDSWPTVVLMWIWPSVLSLVGVFYSVLVIVRVRRYRQEFATILGSSDSKLTKSRFKRLFLMSASLTLIVLPVQFYVLAKNTSYPFIRYNWKVIHGKNWQDIVMVPSEGVVFYDRWVHVATGSAMFIFFGLGSEALKMYHGWLLACRFDKVFPQLRRPPTAPRSASTTSFASRIFPKRAYRCFTNNFSTGSSVGPLIIDTSRRNSVSTFIQSPSPSYVKESCLMSPIKNSKHSASLEGCTYDSVEFDEKTSFVATRKTKPPYVPYFISAFRKPESSRQMPTREINRSV